MSAAPAVQPRPVILVFLRYYLPGFKSGGPVRSISNLIERLGGEFDFRIVCMDRDVLDTKPYEGIRRDTWNPLASAKVWYLGRNPLSLIRLFSAVRSLGHYTLYLNSLFDPLFSLLPISLRMLGLLSPCRVIIAPRGELSPGALGLRRAKKSLFLSMANRAGIYRAVHWHASTAVEREDIVSAFPIATPCRAAKGSVMKGEDIHVASNVFVASDLVKLNLSSPNYNVSNSLVFLSRITPKKNLDFALRALALCRTSAVLNIYGTIEDTAYWGDCLRLISELPSHTKAVYKGALDPDQVPAALRGNSLFLFPTRGENYGHVIAEALAAGIPPLLSDQTPWADLEIRGAGWIRPLGNPQAFADVIDGFLGLPENERKSRAEAVNEYAREKLSKAEDIEDNRKLFDLERETASGVNSASMGAVYGN